MKTSSIILPHLLLAAISLSFALALPHSNSISSDSTSPDLRLAAVSPQEKIEDDGAEVKIVGGVEVARNELPYQLTLKKDGRHFCGASVYNADYIITAAHCAITGSATQFAVVGGKHSISFEGEPHEQRRAVSEVIVHSGYNVNTFVNDIALMKLARPFELNEFVKAIDIPEPSYEAQGQLLVSGWGSTAEGGYSSDVLMKVAVPTVTDDKCKLSYPNMVDTMLCAGYDNGGKDSCQGDSGGPLVVQGPNPFLVGVVSFGQGCARPGYPGVYTEVAKFHSWIVTHAI